MARVRTAYEDYLQSLRTHFEPPLIKIDIHGIIFLPFNGRNGWRVVTPADVDNAHMLQHELGSTLVLACPNMGEGGRITALLVTEVGLGGRAETFVLKVDSFVLSGILNSDKEMLLQTAVQGVWQSMFGGYKS